MRRRFYVALFGACLWPAVAHGQGTWTLQNRGYFDPLKAEPRGANVSVLFWGQSDEVPFVLEPGSRRVWDISLGKEIPIVGYETGIGRTAPLVRGKWGVGVWAPISFHMIEDFKDESNPILNTDYRFGGVVKVQAGLTDRSWLGGKFQFGHESTHLGDEFSVHAIASHPDFERVNVSYEYWEYGISFEAFADSEERHRLTLRHGGIGLFDDAKGYYSDHLLGETAATLTPSTSNFEPSFGLEWRLETAWVRGLGPFVSFDGRHRIVYNYHKANPQDPDERQFSVNVLVGLRRVERRFLEKGLPDLYFRVYHGVNPAGQFRSQKGYTLIGFGVYIEV